METKKDKWSLKNSSQIVIINKSTATFLQAGCPSCRQTNNVKALKGKQYYNIIIKYYTMKEITKKITDQYKIYLTGLTSRMATPLNTERIDMKSKTALSTAPPPPRLQQCLVSK